MRAVGEHAVGLRTQQVGIVCTASTSACCPLGCHALPLGGLHRQLGGVPLVFTPPSLHHCNVIHSSVTSFNYRIVASHFYFPLSLQDFATWNKSNNPDFL